MKHNLLSQKELRNILLKTLQNIFYVNAAGVRPLKHGTKKLQHPFIIMLTITWKVNVHYMSKIHNGTKIFKRNLVFLYFQSIKIKIGFYFRLKIFY